MTIQANQLHLRWAEVGDEEDRAREARLLELLSAEEHQRYRRFRYDRDRRLFLTAHALLRVTLSEFGGLPPDRWAFETNEQGKPFLTPEYGTPPLGFNLTHAPGLAACVVARGPDVGVDVENTDRRTEPGLAGRFFAPAEQAQLEGLSGQPYRRAFFDIWTLKESYVKGRGIGVALPLRSLAAPLPADDRGAIGFSPPPGDPAGPWQFLRFRPTPRHTLAVAVNHAAGSPPASAPHTPWAWRGSAECCQRALPVPSP